MYRGRVSNCTISVGLLTLVFVTWVSLILWLNQLTFLITSKFYRNATKLVLDQTASELLEVGVSLSSENGTFSSDFGFREQDNGSSVSPVTASTISSNVSGCDLYHGRWYYDESAKPLYTNKTCSILRKSQNYQGNGRPDKEYENWRWKPSQCELPQFNATKFLELMNGKTLAFTGDSLARNQMESLMCTLWQVEVPEDKENSTMRRWYFRSKSVTVLYIVSEWLVRRTHERIVNVPEGPYKIHLDIPDGNFIQHIPSCDVVVLCNGHWFVQPHVFLQENKVVGTHLVSLPAEYHLTLNISNTEAFRISSETVFTAMVTHPNYTGLTIVVPYTPDHFKNGNWKTGGSCKGNVRPLLPGQLVQNNFTYTMHEKQLTAFYQAIKKQSNKSRMKLMDITEAFEYRHDGHPGPYDGKKSEGGWTPPQDCLHWCLPGLVDIWNEFMLEILRGEFEGDRSSII